MELWVFLIFGARASGLSFGPRVFLAWAYFFPDFTLFFLLLLYFLSGNNLLSMENHRKTVLLFESKIFAIESEA